MLTVSATGPDDLLYSWSNTGNNVDLAAPGPITTLTGWGSGYGYGRLNAAQAVSMASGGSGGGSGDTTPPTVGFMSPANGAAVSGAISL
jgi:hypothetical protein